VGSFQGEETIAPVRRRPRGDRGETDHQAVRGNEQPHPRTRDEQDGADDEQERERGPEVGLDENERCEEKDEKPERPCELGQGARRLVPRQVRGRPDDDRELRELRRLEDERTDVDPATRAVDPLADREHPDAQHESRHDEARRDCPEPLERETRDDDEQCNADDGVGHLPPDEAEWVGVPERGGSRGRAVHHDEPEEDEGGGDEHEQVPLELVALRSHDMSSTRRRKVSPLSSKFANWS
jgi:hypothetical protein